MQDDEDDDIYAPEEPAAPHQKAVSNDGPNQNTSTREEGGAPQDEESGEELEEEESDSDIDIITEKKDEPKKETPQAQRLGSLKSTAPARSPSLEPSGIQRTTSAVKVEAPSKETPARPGSSYPAVKTSNVDVDAKPIYEPSAKPITEVDMDADFPEDDKPWRRPGTDMTDYFNYGFDEFTWANYCLKQQSLRKEVTDSKKQLDEMQNFMSSGMPGMPSMQQGPGPGMPPMTGLGDIPPEMQQMFAQMMQQGMDPSAMDPAQFMQMMSGGQGGQSGQRVDMNQGYGGQGYGQQHNQQHMGYGYGGGGGGHQPGRGRGRW
ncbi:MAG: hypothetical protein OHK93_005749 [Ramalina farinacea]|uniref:Pre-mRNA polyadenylation factor Fip1 domain-containing protein n=1 Tax=Ramalina farinacea TaxID=258253 RepID=A0AA43QKR4_9LECA|nr:hypothetical protein [Ramalina farinacea]